MERYLVPFVDLSRQYETHAMEIDNAITAVLKSGQYILGSEVKLFENALAEYIGCKYVLGVASGSDAILLALLALGIGKKDDVITTPFTFVASANNILKVGATPVFVDIKSDTYCIDASKIEEKISPRTRAIIPVHLYGHPADMDTILQIAEKYGLYVIEDAAQAIGASYKRKKIGGIGQVAAFSFFPTKNLGAYGDGGAIATNDPIIKARIDVLRKQGAKEKYFHEYLGYNSRLDTIQAAILRIKLKYLDDTNRKRAEIANFYNQELKENNLEFPVSKSDYIHTYHLYTIRSKDRDALKKYLSTKLIQTGIYYPIGLHLQPVFSSLGYKLGDFPVCEKITSEVLSLPCYPELDEQHLQKVCEEIICFQNDRRIYQ